MSSKFEREKKIQEKEVSEKYELQNKIQRKVIYKIDLICWKKSLMHFSAFLF